MARKAYKTTIEFVIFSDAPINANELSGEGDMYDPLSVLIYDVTEGDKIGDWTVKTADEPIEGDALVEALVAIGNDGAFFDDEDDEDDEP